MEISSDVVREWFAAKKVIVAFLVEVMPHLSPAHADRLAVALLARLASQSPPILVGFAED